MRAPFVWPSIVSSVTLAVVAAATGLPVAAADSPSVVCLHTEWLPAKKVEKGVLPQLIVRELGRQAVLIAARDELGLATRDETLGEVFPEAITQEKADFAVRVHGYKDGTTRIDLAPLSEPDEMANTNDEKQTKYDPGVIVVLAESLEEMSHSDLPKRLRGWGFAGKVPAPNEKNLPTDSAMDQLLEMDFVSQFAAVRAAHTAIAENGQSRAWLGVLARGYANLALMTEHHWKSDHQVFAARALLYAERLVKLDPKDAISHAHLAYVEAIVGLHGAALAELDRIDELRNAANHETAMPDWFELLRPYCRFEREPVSNMVMQRKSLRELAQRLSFEQTRAYGDDHWTNDSAKITMAMCPEEYGVYAAIAIPGVQLGVKRMGAFSAPGALARFLPERIAALPQVPDVVREAAKRGELNDTAAANKRQPADEEVDPAIGAKYAAGTVPIVRALRAATAGGGDNHEPSWSVLGELIFEEQFVQAANYLNVSMDATESSHEDEVKSILPAIEGHRYARFIESYAANKRTEAERFNQLLGDVDIVDPRATLQPMLYRAWRSNDSKGGRDVGWHMSEASFRSCDLTYPQLFEAQWRLTTLWTNVEEWERERRASDFAAVSPRSPQAMRLAMAVADKPTYEQARKWEGDAGDDVKSLLKLGTIYYALKNYDDAIRCFERSLELSPSKDGFVNLAYAHRANNQDDMWLPTLERFFEIPSLGLEQASVHNIIAYDYMSKGKWDEAEPHSLAAARTFSAWGLLSAADVYEGQQKYEESEKYIREMSQNYPSTSGHYWYFWCLRNGRGDLEKASEPAHTYFAAQNPDQDEVRRQRFLVYRVAKNDAAAAMKHAKFLFRKHDTKEAVMPTRAFLALQMAVLARELDNEDDKKTPLGSARRTIGILKKDNPDLSSIVQFTCRLLDGKSITEGGIANIDQHLDSTALTESQRCGFEYLIGRSYELHDETEKATTYYRRALARTRSNRELATLAGIRLQAQGKGKPVEKAEK